MDWERVAKAERARRVQVEDSHDRLLDALEGLVRKPEKEPDPKPYTAPWWSTSCTWATDKVYDGPVCLMCHDPHVHRNSNVCASCRDELICE